MKQRLTPIDTDIFEIRANMRFNRCFKKELNKYYGKKKHFSC